MANVYQNPTYLQKDQYKNSSNLDARAHLHRTYSTSKTPWMTWVFDHLQLQEGMTVLECGCGPAWLWRENKHRIPADCQITLTDLSQGMVDEAEEALSESDHAFAFRTANTEELPFADDSFDLVVANHMLYHVPNIDRAVAQIRRVLKPNGRLIAATNGDTHLQELKQLPLHLFPEVEAAQFSHTQAEKLPFRLENGAEILQKQFPKVEQLLFDDGLAVTEVEPLLNYLSSSTEMRQALETNGRLESIRQALQNKLNRDGVINITKSTGIFIAHA